MRQCAGICGHAGSRVWDRQLSKLLTSFLSLIIPLQKSLLGVVHEGRLWDSTYVPMIMVVLTGALMPEGLSVLMPKGLSEMGFKVCEAVWSSFRRKLWGSSPKPRHLVSITETWVCSPHRTAKASNLAFPSSSVHKNMFYVKAKKTITFWECTAFFVFLPRNPPFQWKIFQPFHPFHPHDTDMTHLRCRRVLSARAVFVWNEPFTHCYIQAPVATVFASSSRTTGLAACGPACDGGLGTHMLPLAQRDVGLWEMSSNIASVYSSQRFPVQCFRRFLQAFFDCFVVIKEQRNMSPM